MSGKVCAFAWPPKIQLPVQGLHNSSYSTIALYLYLSLIMGETKLCKYRLRHNNIKLSLEVASTLTIRPIRHPRTGEHFLINSWLTFRAIALAIITAFDPRDLQHPVRHGATTYALGRVTTFWGGVFSAYTLCLRKIFLSALQVYVRPDKLARSHGAFGCLCGIILSPFYVVGYFLKAFVIFIDRYGTGVANGCFKQDKLFVCDPSVQARVYSTSAEIDDILQFTRPGDQRVSDIARAMQLALAANEVFKKCKPCFPPEHWHWRVVKEEKLKDVVGTIACQSILGLSNSEFATLNLRLDRCDLKDISFSRFCLYIAEAVQARFVKVDQDIDDSLQKLTVQNEFDVNVPLGDQENDSDQEGGVVRQLFRSGSLGRKVVRRISLRPSFGYSGEHEGKQSK
jgi:hypothetical protein